MAKATIVFVDQADGTYRVKAKFDPPIEPGQQLTIAQGIGYSFLEALKGDTDPQEKDGDA